MCDTSSIGFRLEEVEKKCTVIWENFVVKIFSLGKRATKIKLTKIY